MPSKKSTHGKGRAPRPATSNEPSGALATRMVRPLPTETVPTPPPDEGASQRDDLRLGGRPQPAHTTHALAAARELRKEIASFRSDFGEHGPGAEELATNLTRAMAWRDERERSQMWDRYVAHVNKQAWVLLIDQLVVFRSAFDHAAKTSPSIETKYPHLAALLAGRRAAGLKAAATRRKRAAKGPKGKTGK